MNDSERINDGLSKEHTKPFLEHLEDLRRTIFWCACAYGLGVLAAIPIARRIVEWLTLPLARTGVNPDEFLKVIRITGGLSIAMRTIAWSGLIIGLPFILVFTGMFVFPGLRTAERKTVVKAVGFSTILFACGVALGYFVTLPFALRLMFRVNALMGVNCDFVELADYVGFVLKLLAAFGLAFQLPVVILALGSLGIIDSQSLRTWRRHVIVGLMIAAMFLTPPDPLTLLLMAGPLALLYEMCIWIIRGWEKRAALT